MKPKSDLTNTALDSLISVMGLLIFLVMISWVQTKDVEDAVEFQKETAQRYAHMLAQCMNGKMWYDKRSDKLFACDKVLEITLNK